jgi:hypothetical protein
MLAVKRSVDPEDVIWCTPCVGNERWSQVAGWRRQRDLSELIEVDRHISTLQRSNLGQLLSHIEARSYIYIYQVGKVL